MKLIEVKSNSSCRRRNNVYQWNKIFIQPVLMFFISSWSLELSTSSSGPFVILGRRRKALGTRLQSSEIVAKLFLVHINDGIHWIYQSAEQGALFSVENIQSKQSFALCRKKNTEKFQIFRWIMLSTDCLFFTLFTCYNGEVSNWSRNK